MNQGTTAHNIDCTDRIDYVGCTDQANHMEHTDQAAHADHELEARYEKYRGILKNLTIMSDMFMRNVFKKRECTEYVLQVIMERKDLKVLDQVLQKDYKNL